MQVDREISEMCAAVTGVPQIEESRMFRRTCVFGGKTFAPLKSLENLYFF